MWPKADKATELEVLRNAALSGSDTYTAKRKLNERYNLLVQVKAVADSMPILTKLTASKLAERVRDRVRSAIMTSIWGKIAAQGELTTDQMIAYVKTQKKDSNYKSIVFSSCVWY